MGLKATDQKGQMAIFVALLFQVLFVFFAMVVNVGLMIHDKINLQNSVDLAAIYGSQKQAEILNAIAHSNFQIHQSWKLLAWRIRLLGDIGRDGHPSGVDSVVVPREDSDPYLNDKPPSVCVDNHSWDFNRRGSNTCQKLGQMIPALKRAPIIFPAPWTMILDRFARQSQNEFGKDCEKLGPQNWVMAAKWLAGFKLDIASRKQVIWSLANNLSQNNFRELSGGAVFDGIRKTLLANLTRSNRDSLDESSIEFVNSLQTIPKEVWLPEIPVIPAMYYTDSQYAKICQFSFKILNPDLDGQFPNYGTESVDPTGLLRSAVYESNQPEEPTRSIWGFEKNPWYVAYVGIKVKTKPRHPFAPFGKGVEMIARSFAKPFGGRIGPWLQRQWLPTENNSSGPMLDLLAPPRLGEGATSDFKVMVPNFSRFPGDSLGLLSRLSLSQMKPLPRNDLLVSPADYASVPSDMGKIGGDVLAWSNTTSQQEPWIRRFEIAGIAPNLFDIMYYSIDPDFNNNYLARVASNFFRDHFFLRQDLGARFGGEAFSVSKQVQVSGQIPSADRHFYHISKSPDQLLTGWAPESIVDYRFPSNFVSCLKQVSEPMVRSQVPVPGSCVVGGRTGYSVKIVSRDFLMAKDLELGGEGIVGPLKNPPPENF